MADVCPGPTVLVFPVKTGILGRSRSAVSGRNRLSRPFNAPGLRALYALHAGTIGLFWKDLARATDAETGNDIPEPPDTNALGAMGGAIAWGGPSQVGAGARFGPASSEERRLFVCLPPEVPAMTQRLVRSLLRSASSRLRSILV